jgi:hypothetical protein
MMSAAAYFLPSVQKIEDEGNESAEKGAHQTPIH